jgi:hypothetical protein
MNKEKYVFQHVAELSARLGIPAPEVYFKDNLDIDLRHQGRRNLGRADRKHHAILIRLRGRPLAEIKNTVSHELIHLAFPKLPHGDGFERYVQALLKGNLGFDGKGLITKITKPAPTFTDELETLLARQKKIDTRIKRLNTSRKKIIRRMNFLKRKSAV